MRLTANVHYATGTTTHQVAKTSPSSEAIELEAAFRLEISDAEGGFLLIRYSREGNFAGDTWHPTLDEAKRQALIEFAIPLGEWRVLNAPSA